MRPRTTEREVERTATPHSLEGFLPEGRGCLRYHRELLLRFDSQRLPYGVKHSPLHRALDVEFVLAVLDDGGDGLERQVAFCILDHVLQIEILNRKVVVAVLVRTPH